MAQFELGRFVEGRVVAGDWWAPRPGEVVELWQEGTGKLTVRRAEPGQRAGKVFGPDYVTYTWPKAAESHQDASRRAVRYFEKKTGRDAFAS